MPARTQLHIDRALTNMSVAYMQTEDVFIADKVFPKVSVNKQSDTYFIYDKDDFFRDEAAPRADGAESAGGDYGVDQAPPYFCRITAFHKDVTEQERVNADDPLKPDQDSQEFVSRKLLLRREIEWATKYFQTGLWGREIAGVASVTDAATQCKKWSDATSDPVKQMREEVTKMIEATGYKPNNLVLSPYAYNALCDHPMILDRIKYSQKGVTTKDILAELFEVPNIYVPYAIQNTQAKGKDGSMSFIMGKNALLCYSPASPGLKTPSAGYIFCWTGLQGAGSYGNRIVRIPMPWLGIETERIEGEMAFDTQIVCKDLGTFFKDIVD
jgi:hypothetical protein